MKDKRKREILRLISEHEIKTQAELSYMLKEAGFPATQATVSRDIKELKLSKMPASDGGQKYVSALKGGFFTDNKYGRVLKEGFISIDKAAGLLVVRTAPGMAMATAASLDAMQLKGVVGTIAGDDTIMLAIATAQDTENVKRRIEEIIGDVK